MARRRLVLLSIGLSLIILGTALSNDVQERDEPGTVALKTRDEVRF
jgi:hypothetical protein